ncbi:hypothetical protein SAMN04487995_1109 [Dyadobacter koreensis]|uniref:EpsG family protein n=1 Tax=Dyadobacter koreensis TaxID=408657 RepID=A0A1H6R8B1_9BACT|nr:hypothetical protein SAMN04487995_1109 [Dyadobacter koreensis]
MAGQYKWYLILLFFLATTLLLQVCARYQYLPITNHFVYDSYTYELRVLYERNIDTFADAFTSLNSLFYRIGPFIFILINTILLLCCVYLCKVFAVISEKSVSLARFIIVFNPYLLIGAVGPNKETFLVFLSLLCFYLYFQRLQTLKFLAFMVAVSALFVRPVFGLTLIITILITPLTYAVKNPVNVFLIILLGYFTINSIPPINIFITEFQGEELYSFQTSNLYEIALFLKVMNQNPILQFPAFAIKTCLILFTPIVRPNSFFSIPYPILDVGYTLMAYALFPCNFALIITFLNKKIVSLTAVNRETQILFIYTLIGILTTIINSNITFRYIFPYSPMIVSLFYLHSLKIRNRILILSLCLIILTFTITLIFLKRDFEMDNSIIPQFMSWF